MCRRNVFVQRAIRAIAVAHLLIMAEHLHSKWLTDAAVAVISPIPPNVATMLRRNACDNDNVLWRP